MFHVLAICAALSWSIPLPPAVPMLVAALPGEPSRRALLVGIDSYPAENRWPALAGPKADVSALRDVLIDRAGFRADDVRTLLDEQATADAIRQGFASMIDASAPGDLLLFYFAGHGSRVPDDSENLEERDRWDETLVPYDATAGSGPCRDIRDEEIGTLIERANRKTDQVVLIFDCCSSGTNTRAETPVGRRFLEPTRRGFGAARTTRHAAAPPTGSGYVPPALKYVALAACRADQSAYEIQVEAPGEPGRKISRGVFSYHLIDALKSLPIGASYADLMLQVVSRVSRSQEDQTPILEGSLAGYVLFEPVAAPNTARFPLEVRSDGPLTLAGGRLHGLSVGDIFSVCGEEAIRDSLAARLGRARLSHVGTTQSVAQWLEASDAARAAGMRTAFLLERGASDVVTPIAVVAGSDAEAANSLVRALESTSFVKCVPPEHAAFVVRAMEARWVTFTADGTELPLSVDATSESQVAALVGDLGRLAAAQRIDRLLRQSDPSRLEIECTLRRVGEHNELLDAIVPDDDGRTRIAPDAPWAVCARNRSGLPLYVHLVTISPDGEINVLEPTLDDAVYTDQEFVTSTLRIEKILPDLETFYRTEPIRLHCIVTPRRLDLSSLKQGPVTLGKVARGISDAPSTERDPLAFEAWSGTRIEIWAR